MIARFFSIRVNGFFGKLGMIILFAFFCSIRKNHAQTTFNMDVFMSVSPTANRLNPPPVPETPTLTRISGFTLWNSSATASVMGNTVLEPSISTLLLREPPEGVLLQAVTNRIKSNPIRGRHANMFCDLRFNYTLHTIAYSPLSLSVPF